MTISRREFLHDGLLASIALLRPPEFLLGLGEAEIIQDFAARFNPQNFTPDSRLVEGPRFIPQAEVLASPDTHFGQKISLPITWSNPTVQKDMREAYYPTWRIFMEQKPHLPRLFLPLLRYDSINPARIYDYLYPELPTRIIQTWLVKKAEVMLLATQEALGPATIKVGWIALTRLYTNQFPWNTLQHIGYSYPSDEGVISSSAPFSIVGTIFIPSAVEVITPAPSLHKEDFIA